MKSLFYTSLGVSLALVLGGQPASAVPNKLSKRVAAPQLQSLVQGPTFTYQGCYAEPSSGRALDKVKSDSSMTVTMCQSICTEGSYAYFGVEYGKECWCGNTLNAGAGKLEESACTAKCAGDKTTVCGGSKKLNIYKRDAGSGPVQQGAQPTIGQYGWQGCYVDEGNPRALSKRLGDDAMSPELCRTLCKGSKYIGLQYGRECWCGETLADKPFRIDPSACDKPCAGDASVKCGAGSRMDLYERDAAPVAYVEPVVYADDCYAASGSGLEKKYTNGKMSVSMCANYAQHNKYSVFAVEDGNNCWVGKQIDTGAAKIDGCNKPCQGNKSQFCGAYSKLNVYSFEPPAPPGPVTISLSGATTQNAEIITGPDGFQISMLPPAGGEASVQIPANAFSQVPSNTPVSLQFPLLASDPSAGLSKRQAGSSEATCTLTVMLGPTVWMTQSVKSTGGNFIIVQTPAQTGLMQAITIIQVCPTVPLQFTIGDITVGPPTNNAVSSSSSVASTVAATSSSAQLVSTTSSFSTTEAAVTTSSSGVASSSAVESTSSVQSTSSAESTSTVDATSSAESTPIVESTPVVESTPIVESTPVGESTPVDEPTTPVEETTPASTSTPEATPATPEPVDPETTPIEDVESTPVETPASTTTSTKFLPSGVIPDFTPEVTPETTPEVTSEATPDSTPEVTPEVTPDVTSDVTPELTPETTPETVVDNAVSTPEASTPDVTPSPVNTLSGAVPPTPVVTPGSQVTPAPSSQTTPAPSVDDLAVITPAAYTSGTCSLDWENWMEDNTCYYSGVPAATSGALAVATVLPEVDNTQALEQCAGICKDMEKCRSWTFDYATSECIFYAGSFYEYTDGVEPVLNDLVWMEKSCFECVAPSGLTPEAVSTPTPVVTPIESTAWSIVKNATSSYIPTETPSVITTPDAVTPSATDASTEAVLTPSAEATPATMSFHSNMTTPAAASTETPLSTPLITPTPTSATLSATLSATTAPFLPAVTCVPQFGSPNPSLSCGIHGFAPPQGEGNVYSLASQALCAAYCHEHWQECVSYMWVPESELCFVYSAKAWDVLGDNAVAGRSYKNNVIEDNGCYYCA